jgi:hypothetical protein
MSEREQAQLKAVPTRNDPPAHTALLQRKCACGSTPGPTGECAECSKERLGLQRRSTVEANSSSVLPIVNEELCSPGQPFEADTRTLMESRFGHDFGLVRVRAPLEKVQAKLNIGRPGDRYEQEADRIAEQIVRASEQEEAIVKTESIASQVTPLPRSQARPEEDSEVQAKRADGYASIGIPNLESRIQSLRGEGRSLPPALREFFGVRFGCDFDQVRILTDARAAETAYRIGARAFTFGHSIGFAPGQYAPESSEGRRLLAHELTHVVQQTMGSGGHALASEAVAETQARRSGERIAAGRAPLIDARIPTGTIQRQEDKNPLDEKAKAIIAQAQNDKIKADERAVQAVRSIIKEYYPSDESKVDSVVYDDEKAGTGVSVTSKGTGETTAGVTERHFARRVLQVGHELEHINQWRSGMAGGQKSAEREFLAFYHEALAPEKPGTGRMQRSTRVNLIDAALGYYYCLTAEQQKQYATNKKELLDRRPGEVKASGHPSTDPPTECKRQ